MPNTPPGMRECPTRADGAHALFAHVIDGATCQERQRGHFHKCPTCTHCNARLHASSPSGVLANGRALDPARNGQVRNGVLHPLPPPDLQSPAPQAEPRTANR